MIAQWTSLRVLATMRRVAIALESIARSQEELAALAKPPAARRKPQPTVFGQLDLQKASEQWERKQEAEQMGVVLPEEDEVRDGQR